MISKFEVDTCFDFRIDSNGRDPDKYSKTLKNFHRILWSKPLPNGSIFSLMDGGKNQYLVFQDSTATHCLSSDSIANSFSERESIARIIAELEPELITSFRNVNSTIGAFILFPGNRIDGKMTINGERGFNSLIADRFDLTLECIRLHYLNFDSPLSSVLQRYNSFFTLFEDFKNYVDFFLLNDLVSFDYEHIEFFNVISKMFEASPIPNDKLTYLEYRKGSMEFTRKRNLRIKTWAKTGQ